MTRPSGCAMRRSAILLLTGAISTAANSASSKFEQRHDRDLQLSSLTTQCNTPAQLSEHKVCVSKGGGAWTCSVVASGAVQCYGANTYGQSTVPSLAQSNQIAVSCGQGHTCSLSAAGRTICWGGGPPVVVPAFAQSLQVSVATGTATCVLSTAGRVRCFDDAQGYGLLAVPAAASSNQVYISAGNQHACSISTSGGVVCWGFNVDGRCDVPAVANSGQVRAPRMCQGDTGIAYWRMHSGTLFLHDYDTWRV